MRVDIGSDLVAKRLRRFRDERLLPSFFGRLFVHVYYWISPPIAAALRKRPACATIGRKSLDMLIGRNLK